ncbi:MAG: prepilin-type N-terminal cleavage/methylation domain-containing protein [Patescibacteria group bacterium]
MTYRNILKFQQGLSLIEIMVALTILTVAFVGLVFSFPFGLSITKEGENTTTASYLAQDKIEELVSLGYANISVGIIEEKHRLSNDSSSYLYFFQRQTEVSYVDGDLNEVVGGMGMKKISSTIYYNNAISKTEKSYSIKTLISEQ